MAGSSLDPLRETKLELSATERLIAARLDMSPESLSRALRDLSDMGLICVNRRHVTLHGSLMSSLGVRPAQPADMRLSRDAARSAKWRAASGVGVREAAY